MSFFDFVAEHSKYKHMYFQCEENPDPFSVINEIHMSCPLKEWEYNTFIKLLHKYNIPYYTHNNENNLYVWDGEALDITKINNFFVMCHEIGHYVICPPQYRHMINYGLGSSPDDKIQFTFEENPEMFRPHNRESDDLDDEDSIVAVFGAFLQFHFGDDISKTAGMIGFDDIDEESEKLDYDRFFNIYLELGLIDIQGNLM